MPQRIPVYNAASDIIAAFSQGLHERRQREQDQLKKEQDKRDYEEKVRQFNEGIRQFGEESAARRRVEDSQIKANQATLDLNKTQKKFAILGAYAQGLAKPKMREDLAPGQNWALKDPRTVLSPMDVTEGDIHIPGSEIVLPEEYARSLRSIDMAKSAGEIEVARQRDVAAADRQANAERIGDERQANLFRQMGESQANLFKHMDESQGRLFGQQQSLQDDRLAASEARRATVEGEKQRKILYNTYQAVSHNAIYKSYVNSANAYQWANQKNYYDINKDSPGARQIDLIYKYMHTQDDSIVRPSEYDVAERGAMSLLQRTEYKVQRFWKPGAPILSPQAEEALRQQLLNRAKITATEFDKLKQSAYESLNNTAPGHGLSMKEFEKGIYNSGITDEQEGVPVRLVPKVVK